MNVTNFSVRVQNIVTYINFVYYLRTWTAHSKGNYTLNRSLSFICSVLLTLEQD